MESKQKQKAYKEWKFEDPFMLGHRERALLVPNKSIFGLEVDPFIFRRTETRALISLDIKRMK